KTGTNSNQSCSRKLLNCLWDVTNNLQRFVKQYFPDGKSDAYSAFILRGMLLTEENGYISMVTMESWMFLSSFEGLRSRIFSNSSFRSLVHMPYLGKGRTSMGINFGTSAFTLRKTVEPDFSATFSCLRYFEIDERGVPLCFPPKNERFSKKSARDFEVISGSPIAYWLSEDVLDIFSKGVKIGDIAKPRKGNTTTNNEVFLRFWPEISISNAGIGYSSAASFSADQKKWCPYNKGGAFRKWFGNNEALVNWSQNGAQIKAIPHSVIANENHFFSPGLTWSTVTSSRFSLRGFGNGYIFDNGGCCVFGDKATLYDLLCFMNSKIFVKLYSDISPTLNFQSGDVARVPYLQDKDLTGLTSAESLAKSDWDAYETSWDFTTLPLLSPDHRGETLEDSYATLRTHWQGMTDEMKALEEENNRIFIDAYGLPDELTPDVPIEEITLTCNPAYRYGVKGSEADRETRLRADTMAEFLSYAVGCMFGRYSLDAPGLILANQGERLEDYLARIPEPRFMPDADNVIPVLDGDWFADDITERFRLFLRVSFGEAHFRENLRYIEDALGKDIRKYFTKDFYADHVKRYKKRPIYWMVSSPKGTFNALIYMHRYRGDTVSVLLNDYLREFITKLEGERARLEKLSDDPTATQGQRTKALKEAATVAKQIDELNDWERDVVFPLAQQKIEIDLDDGVKANYPKFGTALKKIVGVS
ncbi:MAG: BREX-1 system adenine-specific DNA-methyltransferase PglX, partial [Pelagimonas sp.]